MRLLVAAITFGITIGGLFLTTETRNGPEDAEENYAQIIQELNSQNQSNAPTPKSANKPSKITTKTPASSPTQSFAAAPTITLPSDSPTPLPTPISTSTPASAVHTPESTPTPTLTPTPQPTQQNDQIIVTSLTPPPPIKQNSTVQLDIKTAPQAQCAIKVTLPSGSQSSAKGLEDKTANNSGAISWSWRINWNTKPGTAIIEIACSNDSQNFSKTLQMKIIER